MDFVNPLLAPIAMPNDLTHGQVHIWHAKLDEIGWPQERILLDLSPEEQAKSDKYCFTRDKKRYAVKRAILRSILGSYLGQRPVHVSIGCDVGGKPVLKNAGIQFSVAESAGMAVYAVTRGRRVGVDIEQIRDIPEMDQIAARFFSEREATCISRASGGSKQRAFFRCWTRKEAVIKALGVGLAMTLSLIETSIDINGPEVLIMTVPESDPCTQWFVRDLSPNAQYAGAVAIEGHSELPIKSFILNRFCERVDSNTGRESS